MLIGMQRQMECFLDIPNSSFDVQNDAIRLLGLDGKSVRFREPDHSFIIALGWSESLRELLRCQILTIKRAYGVVDIAEQLVEFGAVSQRQADCKMQLLRGWQSSDRL